MSSAKWRPSCLGLNVLMKYIACALLCFDLIWYGQSFYTLHGTLTGTATGSVLSCHVQRFIVICHKKVIREKWIFHKLSIMSDNLVVK